MSTIETLKNYQAHYLNVYAFSYKRYLHRIVDFDQKLIGIIGARGVGKTTFLLQHLREDPLPMHKKLYFSADALDLDSLFDVAYAFARSGGALLIIDEIHKYKHFESELKKIYDMLDLKVIFSGSSALRLDHAKGDLSRRAIIYQMQGLSFREFIEIETGVSLPHFTLEDLLVHHEQRAYELLERFKPFEYWSTYLREGYYPFYFEDRANYLLRLKQTVDTVIEVDIPSIFPIDYDKIINLKKLIRLVCLSQPFKINIKELSTKIGIGDYQTLYRYMEYLRRGRLLNLLRPRTRGDTIFVKPEKLYLANTNLHFAYCDRQEAGTLREVFLMSMFDEERMEVSDRGDFVIDRKWTIEVGGSAKGFRQIRDIPDSYVAADGIEVGSGNKIPLWLFGFLY